MQLDGKKILITGDGPEIGIETVKVFAREGAALHVVNVAMKSKGPSSKRPLS